MCSVILLGRSTLVGKFWSLPIGEERDFFNVHSCVERRTFLFGVGNDTRTIGCRGIVSGLVTRYFGSCERAKWGVGPPIIHFIRRMSSKALLSIGEGRRSGGGDVKFRLICSIQPSFSLCLNLNTYTGQ